MKQIANKYLIHFIVAILFSFLVSLLQIMDATIFQKMVDYIVALDINKTIEVIIITVIITILSVLASYAAKKSYFTFSKLLQSDLKSDLIQSYLSKNYLDYFSIGSGEYVGKIVGLTNEIEEKYFFPLYQINVQGTRAIVSLIAIYFFNWQMGILTCILISFEFLIPLYRKKHIKKASVSYLNKYNDFSSYVENTMNGYEVIKSRYDISVFKSLFKKQTIDYESAKYKQHMTITISNNLMSLSHQLVILLPWLLGAYLIYRGHMTFGTLMAVSQLNNLVTEPLNACYTNYNTLQSGKEIVQSISKDLTIVNNNEYTDLASFKSLSLNDVKFYYNNNLVLDNISFTFEFGKKYLIVGSSGSGKSTLIKMLSGLIEPKSGSIKINNIDFNKINPLSLKKIVSYVPQKSYLFNDTVYNNISLYEDYSIMEIQEAAKLASIHEDIMNLSQNYNTLLGASGNQLSGGQLTRLSLARAIANKPKVIILDEVTSALDEKLHQEIENVITNLNFTVISISHRADNRIKKKYDYILEINNGKLIEI